jgi:hypothetical protein
MRRPQTVRVDPLPISQVVPIGPSPLIEAGARTARNTDEMREHLAVLTEATRISLEQSRQTEKFAKRMTLASFVVAVCTLAAAVITLFHH